MGLVLKNTSKWWYGRPLVQGKRLFVNLGVEVKGRRPASLRVLGDQEFEASRKSAQAVYDSRYGTNLSHNEAAEYHRKMYLLLTGVDLGRRDVVLIKDLPGLWKDRTARKNRAPLYVKRATLAIDEFVAFAQKKRVQTMAGVTHEVASAWVRHLEDSGLAPGTVECKVIVVRSAFNLLAAVGGVAVNPFRGVDIVRGDVIHRRPLTEAELLALVAAADDVVRGPIITGMCTAMRRADCCLLKWEDVDLAAGFIRVKTAKTGVVVEIPILPVLERELIKQKETKETKNVYVWPEAALMIKSNSCGVSYRVKKAIEAAKIERNVKRGRGQRLASVVDFHSLRTTWITLALSAGVPMELVRRVTGHAGVDVVLKHYFRPGREQFKAIVAGAMGDVGGMRDER
jgi:integrase